MNNSVDGEIKRLKKIAFRSVRNGMFEKALAALSSASELTYYYNQKYIDENLEEEIKSISLSLLGECNISKRMLNPDTVLFYDGFGFDTRGLALIYLKGLIANGYIIIYVTNKGSKNKQPEILKNLKGHKVQYCYINMYKGYIAWIKELLKCFVQYKPFVAFFYTTPFDVSGCVVFEHFDGVIKRLQIDLTDHAFWIGKYAFDYCVELRSVGSQISANYRNIDIKKLVLLPYYAYYDENESFKGFPFDDTGKRVVFSGGALYKTLGDLNNTYYQIVEYILNKYDDIIFLYAGFGDSTELEKIISKYPNRAYHIDERKDLFQILQRSVFYLNTYPMFGGLMMNYAVTAGKLPLTLKHKHDADGLLFNQDKLGIEFETVEDLLKEIDYLLTDSHYLQEKEKQICHSVITKEIFEKNLKTLIEKNQTDFVIDDNEIDTSSFIAEFKERFNLERAMYKSIVKRDNWSLIFDYPILFIKKTLYRMNKKM